MVLVPVVTQDASELFLLLLFYRSKPFLIVIYVLHAKFFPCSESEIHTQLEQERPELENVPD